MSAKGLSLFYLGVVLCPVTLLHSIHSSPGVLKIGESLFDRVSSCTQDYLGTAEHLTAAAGYTGSVYGVLMGTYDTANNPFCNLDIDCPTGLWCNSFYKTATFAGQCQGNC